MALRSGVAKAGSKVAKTTKEAPKAVTKTQPKKKNIPTAPKSVKSDENVNKPTPQRVQVEKGVEAMFGCLKCLDEKNAKLFESDPEIVSLQVNSIKVPQTTQHPIKTVLKNPIWTQDSEICLIVKDLEKGLRVDHEPTVAHFKEYLDKKGLEGITEEMSLRQLKVEYKPFEAKSKFAKRFDVVLVDSRILRFVPKFLGKPFYETGKLPVAFNMGAKDLQQELKSALSISYMSMMNRGTCTQIQVGHTQHTVPELTENIMAVCEALEKKFPGGFKNIRSLNLRPGNRDFVVPLFVSLEMRDSVQLPKAEEEALFIEDELTTIAPGQKVRVFKDGNVEIIEDKDYTPGPLDEILENTDNISDEEDEEEQEEESESEEEVAKEVKTAEKKDEDVSDEESSDGEDFEQAYMKRKAFEDVEEGKSKKQKAVVEEDDSEDEGVDEDDDSEQEEVPVKQMKKPAQKQKPNQKAKQKKKQPAWKQKK